MKIKILIIGIISLFFLNSYRLDNGGLTAIIATSIDSKIEKIIENHIRIMQKKFVLDNNDYYICLMIEPEILAVDDSIKNFVNQYYYEENFSKIVTCKNYKIYATTESSKSFTMKSLNSYVNRYYFKYRNRNILIASKWPIRFNNDGIIKRIQIGSEKPKDRITIRSSYMLSYNYLVQMKWKKLE